MISLVKHLPADMLAGLQQVGQTEPWKLRRDAVEAASDTDPTMPFGFREKRVFTSSTGNLSLTIMVRKPKHVAFNGLTL